MAPDELVALGADAGLLRLSERGLARGGFARSALTGGFAVGGVGCAAAPVRLRGDLLRGESGRTRSPASATSAFAGEVAGREGRPRSRGVDSSGRPRPAQRASGASSAEPGRRNRRSAGPGRSWARTRAWRAVAGAPAASPMKRCAAAIVVDEDLPRAAGPDPTRTSGRSGSTVDAHRATGSGASMREWVRRGLWCQATSPGVTQLGMSLARPAKKSIGSVICRPSFTET